MSPRNLTPSEASDHLRDVWRVRRSVRTLANLRSTATRGEGPPYLRDGTRILYPVAGLDRWAQEILGEPARHTGEERARGVPLPDMSEAREAKL